MDFSHLPYPADRNIAIQVKPAAERALREGHPWLFDQSIRSQSKDGAAGDRAIVFDRKRRFLAAGLYDPDSPIRVKLLQHGEPATIDTAFFRQKLEAALQRRASLAATATTGYRLVHGENDGLPGLVVDRYADTLVIKLYSAAWFAHLRDILPQLASLTAATRWVLRLSRGLQAGETYGLQDGQVLRGELPTESITFEENGLCFAADVLHGHKTGFFFDQRDNRYQVRQLAEGKRVLDLFAYNGGFAVNAAAGGATSVLSVDISAPALDSAQANMQRNNAQPQVAACQYHTRAADVFEVLDTLDESFDMVIVDPPSFANSADQIQGALHAYTKLTRAALRVTKRGGILVSASCSSRISSDAFFSTVFNAAHASGVALHEIARTTHAVDHPIAFPEGAYLKCLFAHVR